MRVVREKIRLGSDITKDVRLPGVKTKFVYRQHPCTCTTTERSLVLCFGCIKFNGVRFLAFADGSINR